MRAEVIARMSDAAENAHAEDAAHDAAEPHGASDHGETHGHDDHGHMDEPLGPVDWPMWISGAAGVVIALLMWGCFIIGTS